MYRIGVWSKYHATVGKTVEHLVECRRGHHSPITYSMTQLCATRFAHGVVVGTQAKKKKKKPFPVVLVNNHWLSLA